MRAKSYMLFMICFSSLFIVPAHAAAVTMTAQNGQFQAKMTLSLYQNMTALPDENVSIDASQDSNMRTGFANALQQADSSAKLAGLSLRVTSTNNWLNISANMGVAGVSTINGDVATLNTTWKSFHVASDLRAQKLSYNAVGSAYLRSVADYYLNASKYEMKPNATITAVTFFANGTSVPGDRVADQLGNFSVFDFSSLNVPIEQWNRTYNIQNDTTTWRYTPQQSLAVGIAATRGLNNTYQLFANYRLDAEIVVPGVSRGSGNTLIMDVGSGRREMVMIGAVLLFAALGVAAEILFRSRRRRVILGRR